MAFTGTEEIYNGYNRKLFFTTDGTTIDHNTDADATTPPVWNELGYDDGFSFTENDNETQKYNKRELSHMKKGRKEYNIDISQLYSGVEFTIFQYKQTPGTLKMVLEKDDGTIGEVHYFQNAYIQSPSFNGGSDDGDDTISATGRYADRVVADGDGSTSTELYSTK